MRNHHLASKALFRTQGSAGQKAIEAFISTCALSSMHALKKNHVLSGLQRLRRLRQNFEFCLDCCLVVLSKTLKQLRRPIDLARPSPPHEDDYAAIRATRATRGRYRALRTARPIDPIARCQHTPKHNERHDTPAPEFPLPTGRRKNAWPGGQDFRNHKRMKIKTRYSRTECRSG